MNHSLKTTAAKHDSDSISDCDGIAEVIQNKIESLEPHLIEKNYEKRMCKSPLLTS
jgi:hypothetical protein